MSVVCHYRGTVRGNPEILEEFMDEFEEDNVCMQGHLDGNCYTLESSGHGDADGFPYWEEDSKAYPSLKFDIFSDEEGDVRYSIYMNGKCLSELSGEFEERCEWCNNYKLSNNHQTICELFMESIEGQEEKIDLDDLSQYPWFWDERIGVYYNEENKRINDEIHFVDFPVEILPDKNITNLEISNCFFLENLPKEISNLSNLRSFKITRSRISSFPVEFWRMTNLSSLEILVCPRLETIPAEIESLSGLTSLSITGCENLKSLAEEIAKLDNLTSLRIYNCHQLQLSPMIHELPNLMVLEIEDSCIIKEKGFPRFLPADVRGKFTEIVNEAGERIALFYHTDLFKAGNTFSTPEEYCSAYDRIWEDYYIWDNAGLNPACESPDEQEGDYGKIEQSLQWDSDGLMQIRITKDSFFDFLLMFLCRLAYPYHCDVEKIKKNCFRLDNLIINAEMYFFDIQVLRKAFELGWVKLNPLLQHIISNGWIFDHPQYWLTASNIEACLDYALKNNHIEVTGFLLEYKHTMGLQEPDFILYKETNPPAILDLEIKPPDKEWATKENPDGSLTITRYHGSLVSAVIPEGVTKIRRFAFKYYDSLVSVVIPRGVTKIGRSAFENCASLVSVVIPEGVERIGTAAFINCSSLTSLVIPASVTEIGEITFRGCHSLVIHAPIGSYAIEYAKSNDIKFVET